MKKCSLEVLFVCTGNICRSPTAERLAVAIGSAPSPDRVCYSSAGTQAVISAPIHPTAALVLESLGGASAGFQARQLSQRIAQGSDLILTMTRAHRERVLELAPQQLNRTFTLTEVASAVSSHGAQTIEDLVEVRPHVLPAEISDVRDPIGQDIDVFLKVGTEIADLLLPVVELCNRSARNVDGRK